MNEASPSAVDADSVAAEGAARKADSERNRKLFDDAVAEARKRELSSYENYDKTVLTLSGTGLAVSLSFLKDFVPIDVAVAPLMLYSSWAALTFATCATTISFLAAAESQVVAQVIAHEYYMEDKEGRKNPWDSCIHLLNRSSGAAFVVGVILTTLFVSLNLEKAAEMSETKRKLALDGIPSASLQNRAASSSTSQRGATSAPLVPKVSTPAPAPATTSPPPSSAPPSGTK